MKSARCWITFAAFLLWRREHMSVALSSNQSWCRLSMLPRVDCEAIRRAEERAWHSIVMFEVQFNVVVVDMRYKDWAMALRSSSLMFWLWAACTLSSCLGSSLRAGGLTVSRNVERIRRWSVELSAPRMTINLNFIKCHGAWQWRSQWGASVWTWDSFKKSCACHGVGRKCLWW